jgi:hypothetical protein
MKITIFTLIGMIRLLQNVRIPFIDLINNNNYNFKHLDIREPFIWLMSNEDNFIINQLSDMILKLVNDSLSLNGNCVVRRI